MVVVTLAIILPVIYSRYSTTPPPSPAAGTNVKVDEYVPASAWAGQFGDDPTVAVAPNGTIAVAWEGLNELGPPSSPMGLPSFDTAIFVSYSYDGGAHYSTPLFVGSPGTVAALTPSLAFSSNGTLYVAYVNATNSIDQQIVVKAAPPGQNFSTGVVAETGQVLERPLLFVLSNGSLVLAFQYSDLIEWASSTDGGLAFGAPTVLGLGILTGGTEWGSNEITLVGLSAGATVFTTVGIWSCTFSGTGTGTPVQGNVATITIPYPYSYLLPNLSFPGPTVAEASGLLFVVYAAVNESELRLETSNTNGSDWAGPWTLQSGQNLTFEMPAMVTGPGGSRLALAWQAPRDGFWRTFAALYDVRTGLLSAPEAVSSAPGFSATVRNWHGTGMGLAIANRDQFTVAWGDGRGLNGTFGLTQIYASTLTAQF